MTKPLPGKTVFIMGAGASRHSGAPLLRDFLDSSRVLHGQNPDLKYAKSFERIFDWIETLKKATHYLNLDLRNLEHLFSLVTMLKELDDSDGSDLHEDMSRLIFETLDYGCEIPASKEALDPTQYYKIFLDQILTNGKEKINKSPGIEDTIITLNYDVLLDFAFWHKSIDFNYCLPNSDSSGYKLLKLHGSMNWATHPGCEKIDGKTLQEVEPQPIAPGHIYSPRRDSEPRLFPFRMFTHVLANTECVGCKKKDVLLPVFIPPTWSKRCESPELKNVWKHATQEIRQAWQIVIMGYSLPDTDTFLSYLLTIGLRENSSLRQVIVIDSDGSEEFKKRYKTTFSSNLTGTRRLIFLNSRFENIVGHQDFKSIVAGKFN